MVAEPADNVTPLDPRRVRILGPIQLARRYSTTRGSARSVLTAVASYLDADTLEGWVGHATLTRDTGLSEQTVRRGIRVLVDAGELAVVRLGDGKHPTRYRLTLSPPVGKPVDNPPKPDGTRTDTGTTLAPRGYHPGTPGGTTLAPLPIGTRDNEGGPVGRTCGQHAGNPNPPPCQGCRKAREAFDAATAAERKAATERRRFERMAADRRAVEHDRANATPPPPAFRAARRRTPTPDRPPSGTVNGDPERMP